jgi:hypothetical protein
MFTCINELGWHNRHAQSPIKDGNFVARTVLLCPKCDSETPREHFPIKESDGTFHQPV